MFYILCLCVFYLSPVLKPTPIMYNGSVCVYLAAQPTPITKPRPKTVYFAQIQIKRCSASKKQNLLVCLQYNQRASG